MFDKSSELSIQWAVLLWQMKVDILSQACCQEGILSNDYTLTAAAALARASGSETGAADD